MDDHEYGYDDLYTLELSSILSHDIQITTAQLLYHEWGGNLQRRLEKLQLTYDESLKQGSFILIQTRTNKPVGHVEIKPAVLTSNKDVIGAKVSNGIALSVIIDKNHRNKGIGRILMHKIEIIAHNLFNYSYLYLWTDNALIFYQKLKYNECII